MARIKQSHLADARRPDELGNHRGVALARLGHRDLEYTLRQDIHVSRTLFSLARQEFSGGELRPSRMRKSGH